MNRKWAPHSLAFPSSTSYMLWSFNSPPLNRGIFHRLILNHQYLSSRRSLELKPVIFQTQPIHPHSNMQPLNNNNNKKPHSYSKPQHPYSRHRHLLTSAAFSFRTVTSMSHAWQSTHVTSDFYLFSNVGFSPLHKSHYMSIPKLCIPIDVFFSFLFWWCQMSKNSPKTLSKVHNSTDGLGLVTHETTCHVSLVWLI